MHTITWISRPNQFFHCHFALVSAIAMAYKGHRSTILVCNNSDSYCVVKYQLGISHEMPGCESCDSGINFIKGLHDHLLSTAPEYVSNLITLVFTRELYAATSASSDEISSQYDIFRSLYSGGLHDAFPSIDWLSEACTITGLTPIDLTVTGITPIIKEQIALSIRHGKLCTHVLEKYGNASLLAYNGRFTAAKSWISTFRKKNLPVVVHESGLHPDSFTLNRNWSVEEHFLYLPEQFFASQDYLSNLAETVGTSRLNSYFIQYMMPKLTGHRSYYLMPAINGSQTTSKVSSEKSLKVLDSSVRLLVLASSYDEVSCPFPFDKTLLEQNFIQDLVQSFLSAHQPIVSSITVRFHPRSGSQLSSSQQANGCFSRFYGKLKDLEAADQDNRLKVVHPLDRTPENTSYQLMKHSTHVLSLFSIASIEAGALGKSIMCHQRCRGSTVIPSPLHGESVTSLLNQTTEWLQSKSEKSKLAKIKKLSRAFLGYHLFNSYIYPQSFKFFLPTADRDGDYISHLMSSLATTKWTEDPAWSTVERLLDNHFA